MIGIYRHDIHDMLQWASDITRHLVDMISLKLFGTQSTIFTATVRKAPAICKTSTQNLQYVNVAVCMFVWQVWPQESSMRLICLAVCYFFAMRSLASSVGLSQSLQAFLHFPHLLQYTLPLPVFPGKTSSWNTSTSAQKHQSDSRSQSTMVTMNIYDSWFGALHLRSVAAWIWIHKDLKHVREASVPICPIYFILHNVTVLRCAPAHKYRLSIHSHRRLQPFVHFFPATSISFCWSRWLSTVSSPHSTSPTLQEQQAASAVYQSGQYYDSEFCTQTGARQACEIQEYLAPPRNIIEKIHNITMSWYIYKSCMHRHAISVSLQVLPFQHPSRPSHFKRIW